MTDEVGRLVLRNNYLQTLALSLAQRRGAGRYRLRAAPHAALERRAGSTAQSSSCPTTPALAERARAASR